MQTELLQAAKERHERELRAAEAAYEAGEIGLREYIVAVDVADYRYARLVRELMDK